MAEYWVLVDFTSVVYNIPWIGFSQPAANADEILFMEEPVPMPGAFSAFWYLDNVVYEQNAAFSQIGTAIDNETDVNSGLDIIKTNGQVYQMSHYEWAKATWDITDYHLASEFTPEQVVGSIETISLTPDYTGWVYSYTAPDYVWVKVEREGDELPVIEDELVFANLVAQNDPSNPYLITASGTMSGYDPDDSNIVSFKVGDLSYEVDMAAAGDFTFATSSCLMGGAGGSVLNYSVTITDNELNEETGTLSVVAPSPSDYMAELALRQRYLSIVEEEIAQWEGDAVRARNIQEVINLADEAVRLGQIAIGLEVLKWGLKRTLPGSLQHVDDMLADALYRIEAGEDYDVTQAQDILEEIDQVLETVDLGPGGNSLRRDLIDGLRDHASLFDRTATLQNGIEEARTISSDGDDAMFELLSKYGDNEYSLDVLIEQAEQWRAEKEVLHDLLEAQVLWLEDCLQEHEIAMIENAATMAA